MFTGRRFNVQELFGPVTPAVRLIVIVTTAVYALEFVPPIGSFIQDLLVLDPYKVLHQGMVWQLVTYLLVHATNNPWHLVFNMLGLWMFGGPVESSWGSRRFYSYYLLTGVGAGLCTFATGSATLGASGAVFGVLIAFAMLFPNSVIYVMGIFPMKAMAFALVLIAIEFAFMMGGGNGSISYVAHLGGAGIGWLYLKFSWRISAWWNARGSARRGGGGRRSGLGSRRNPPSRMRPLREVPGAAPARSASPSGREAPRPRPTGEDTVLQKKADEILDKISRDGMGSLTREEREILQRHSQNLRQRESDVVNLDDYRS